MGAALSLPFSAVTRSRVAALHLASARQALFDVGLRAALLIAVHAAVWWAPSRDACRRCHQAQSGAVVALRVLGK
jgi:hypothetical protein